VTSRVTPRHAGFTLRAKHFSAILISQMSSRIASYPQYASLLLVSLAATTFLPCCGSQAQSLDAPPGIAWAVKGTWLDLASGKSIETGSFVHPGALLKPQNPDASNSITVLLPDGQRILDECFTATDCNRGFRIPALIERPTEFQAQMLERIGAALAQQANPPHESPAAQANVTPPRLDEAVAVLAPQIAPSPTATVYNMTLTGPVAALPNGNYSCELRRIGANSPAVLRQSWSKTSAVLALPSPGIFEIVIRDDWGAPRIDLMVAAILPTQPDLSADFARAKSTFQAWDEVNYGWPVHQLLRAYLQSLYLPAAQPARAQNGTANAP